MERVSGVSAFRLVAADRDGLVRFYVERLGFETVGGPSAIDAGSLARLGIAGGGVRQRLRLGRQILEIESFEDPGRPYPAGGDAASPWFQHFALVTRDIAAAFARLGAVTPISTAGPEVLPPSSGGVTAFKFRDPEGHPLELLQFVTGSEPEAWRDAKVGVGVGGSCLGIDHSAISVTDVASSIAFYGSMGLSVGERTFNHGPAQAHLDGIDGVEVDVVGLSPAIATPHLELLGYRGSHSAGGAPQGNDVAATRVVWHGARDAAFVDPDGHWHEVATTTVDGLSGS